MGWVDKWYRPGHWTVRYAELQQTRSDRARADTVGKSPRAKQASMRSAVSTAAR